MFDTICPACDCVVSIYLGKDDCEECGAWLPMSELVASRDAMARALNFRA